MQVANRHGGKNSAIYSTVTNKQLVVLHPSTAVVDNPEWVISMMDGTLIEELVTDLTLETNVRSSAAIYTSRKNKNRTHLSACTTSPNPPDRLFLVIPR